MEQQDQVQSVKEEGSYAQETTELSINDVTAPYEFRGGLYYCKDLEGAYTSIQLLQRAWATKVRADRIKAARYLASGEGRSDKSPQVKEKARKEYRKWQATEIK